jgi:hypothetical protein
LEKPLVSFLDAQFHYGIWYKLIRYSKSIWTYLSQTISTHGCILISGHNTY